MSAAPHVIVVGAGSAGSVLARRLHDAGARVTLIEAGSQDTNPAIHDPMRMGELWHSAQDWDHYTVPQEHAANRRLHLPRGKVVGGSHALNAMIWVRCAPEDFDHWAQLGNEGWSWADVLPIYRDIEAFSGGASETRGGDGLLPVSDDYPLQPIQAAIIEAGVQSGMERNPDYNGDHLDGISQQQVTITDGKRVSTWRAYAHPVRDELDVRTDCQVHSVLLENGQAVGVRTVDSDGATDELRADLVVLSAGALESPAILLRSGIGPQQELAEVGVPVQVDSPGVGKNLHDHLLSPVIFTTTEREVGPPTTGSSVTQSHHFWRSREDLPVPDTQPIHFSVPMYGEDLEPVAADGFSLMAGIVTPRSRGSVTLSGPEVDDRLQIDLAALEDAEDVRSLVASVRQCREIGRQPALAEWGAVEIYPGPDVDDADLEDYVRRTAITYHHQVGTCRMGVDDEAVVDPRLRVRGVDGLRVVDASIMPTITTGNTNAPAVLIGEQGARFIVEDLGL